MSKGKKALMIVSIVILVCVLAFVAYKLFQVRKITVTGCETISAETVVSLSGLEYDQSIFTVDTQKIMDAVATEPYLKPISVDFDYPDGVVINVQERKPAAYLEKEGAMLLIDEECWLLSIVTQPEAVQYPLVTGLQLDAYTVGEQLGSKDAFVLDVLSRVMIAAKNSGLELTGIDVSLAADIVLSTKTGFTVEIGDDTELETKLDLIKKSIQELGKRGKKGGILDVSSAENAYYREK